MSPVLGVIASSNQQGRGVAVSAYDALASVTIASDSTTNLIYFTGIPGDYTHLQLRMYARSQRSQLGDAVYMRFNGDSGNNYSRHQITGDGSTVSSSGFAPENVVFLGTVPGNLNNTSIFGVGVIDILDYASSTKNKTVRGLDGYDANGSGISEMRYHSWQSTAPVGSLVIANYSSGDFFNAGTQFALYGVK
jgi:hypothetical protein